MKRLLIIPVIAALALAAGVGYAAWGGGGDGGERVSGVPSESIDVHGDWRIAIYNEDGSLDDEYAFSNDLLQTGESLLPQFLARVVSIGTWEIILSNPPGFGPCGTECNVGELLGPGTESDDLVVEFVDQAGNGPNLLRLSGSLVAPQDGDITRVETSLFICTTPLAPGECGSLSSPRRLTGTDLAETVSVTEGQSIQVQVDISFGSGVAP
jgi:hypothetical protein